MLVIGFLNNLEKLLRVDTHLFSSTRLQDANTPSSNKDLTTLTRLQRWSSKFGTNKMQDDHENHAQGPQEQTNARSEEPPRRVNNQLKTHNTNYKFRCNAKKNHDLTICALKMISHEITTWPHRLSLILIWQWSKLLIFFQELLLLLLWLLQLLFMV